MKPSVVCRYLAFLCWLPVSGFAADELPIEAKPIAENTYLLSGTMANSVALVGPEGVLLIDSGDTAEVAAGLRVAMETITPTPVRWLVNTHWHYDHVNGNGEFAGHGAVIIGHTAMRRRAATQSRLVGGPPLPAAELPVLTFDEALTLHLNGEEVRLLHPRGAAHTDGDTVVIFAKANVAHLGDVYFEGLYPYIDVSAGGSAAGIARAVREILPLLDDQTKVVPGHGPLSNKAQLADYAAMLEDVNARVSALKAEGRTLEQIQAARPTAAHDERWGRGFFKPEQFVQFVFDGLAAATP